MPSASGQAPGRAQVPVLGWIAAQGSAPLQGAASRCSDEQRLWAQAVRRALEEIVLKKRPPVVPKVPPKPRQIQAPQPSKPGQRQLELVYVHECRCALPLTSDNQASPIAERVKQAQAHYSI